MTRPSVLTLGCLLVGSACRTPGSGTFVGNPTLTARLTDNAVQQVQSGVLQALEVHFRDCEEEIRPLDLTTFTFDGPGAQQVVEIPRGEHCGLFFVVDWFEVRFEAEGEPITVRAEDFDLVVSDEVVAGDGDRFVLWLGSEAWLSNVAAFAAPGENVVDGSNPALDDAFFDGLLGGSRLVESPPGPASAPLAGRLNLEGWPESPFGTPTSIGSCGAGEEHHMAVPIPPAAMASLGVGDTEVGWCEGPLRFSDELEPIPAVQLDYSDLSTYGITYNGWGRDCDGLHCSEVYSSDGTPRGRPCTVLALCDEGTATVTGFFW